MDDRTLTALKGSIAKWEAIANGTGEDQSCDNCPLCAEFPQYDCGACPVAEHAGQPFCEGTPYQEWSEHHTLSHSNDDGWYAVRPGCPECLRLARAELDFLTSLLPGASE